jgi:hypothetical protein
MRIRSERNLYANPSGTITDHRFIAQKTLGKRLTRDNEIHHFNLNGYSTLVICENGMYHKLLHVRQRAYEATGDPHKRRCRFCKNYDSIENLSENTDYRLGAVTSSYYHKWCNTQYTNKKRGSTRYYNRTRRD